MILILDIYVRHTDSSLQGDEVILYSGNLLWVKALENC